MTDQIQVSFVNPRQGNRPASIKDANGTYYTVSDNAIGWFSPGTLGAIDYWTNERGYKVATHWNGNELPKDQRRGGPQASQENTQSFHQSDGPPPQPPAQPAPTAPVAPPRPQQSASGDKDRLIWMTGIVGRAMGSGNFGVNEIGLLARSANLAYQDVVLGNGDPDDGTPF